MSIFKASLKEATWTFLLSRCLILLVGYVAIVFIPQIGSGATFGCSQHCFSLWNHWDVSDYIRVAYQGYASTPDVAFFPLWPMLLHFGGLLFGGSYPHSYYVAGLLLSNLCFFISLMLFYALIAGEFDALTAKRALFYLSFYPYALFFFVGYTESLFIMLCLAVFLLLRRGKTLDWWLAGALGFLAALTRSAGVLLCIPFFILYLQRFWLAGGHDRSSLLQKLHAFVPLALIPAGLLTYTIYLAVAKGNPRIVQVVEVHDWNRHFALLWHAFSPAVKRVIRGPWFSIDAAKDALDFLFTALPILVLALGWRRLPLHYSLFALALILFSLSFPLGTINSLASQPRYIMTAFPVIVVCALWGKRLRFDQLYVALAIAVLALNILLFLTNYWVA